MNKQFIATAAGQKWLMRESVGQNYAAPLLRPTADYGCDPLSDGMFRMVPSGDIVSFEEMRRRLPQSLRGR